MCRTAAWVCYVRELSEEPDLYTTSHKRIEERKIPSKFPVILPSPNLKNLFQKFPDSIDLLLQLTSNYRGERMPARKVKNDNKEKELMEKLEPVEEEKEDTAEQINIEEEPTKSVKRK
jgi:hypothetical protein